MTLGMLLHYLGKLKIPIFCRYSADMEENANKLHFECTNKYRSPVISHGQSCLVACPVDSKLNHYCLNVFFSAGTARSAAAWLSVNCAYVVQLLQQLINTTICLAFLRKFVCQSLCCILLQIQTFFYQNLVIVAEYHVDCWQTLQ